MYKELVMSDQRGGASVITSGLVSQIPDTVVRDVTFWNTCNIRDNQESLTNIGALLANKSARSQIRKKEVLTSLDPSFPYWLESCPNKCLATSNNICAFSRWMIMRFEPQVPNTMSLKVVREEADRGEPYRSERANHLCMKEVFPAYKMGFCKDIISRVFLRKSKKLSWRRAQIWWHVTWVRKSGQK